MWKLEGPPNSCFFSTYCLRMWKTWWCDMKSDVKHLRGNNDGNLRAHPQFYLETVPSGQFYRQLESVLHVFQFVFCWAQGLREQGARNFKVRWLSFRSPIFNVGALKRAKEPGVSIVPANSISLSYFLGYVMCLSWVPMSLVGFLNHFKKWELIGSYPQVSISTS